jgi:HEAT repeat protein
MCSGCSSKDAEEAPGGAATGSAGIDETAVSNRSAAVTETPGAATGAARQVTGSTPPQNQGSGSDQDKLEKVFAKFRSLPTAEDKLTWLRLVLAMCRPESLRLPIASGALGDDDPAVRCGAVKLLAAYDAETMAPAFEIGLKDPCEEVRLAVVETLRSQAGPGAAALLARAAKDDSAAVRDAAAAALRERKTSKAPPTAGTTLSPRS